MKPQGVHTRAHSFYFLLVKCVLNSGVDHTWWRSSASLIYERCHGHQVKLKKVHFTPFTLKVGSKFTYIILKALVWRQQIYIVTSTIYHSLHPSVIIIIIIIIIISISISIIIIIIHLSIFQTSNAMASLWFGQ